VVIGFMPGWVEGEFSEAKKAFSLGGHGVGGVLAERVVAPATGVVRLPDSMSFEAAPTLPCAGVTAWSTLFERRPVQPDETVLLLGTGGVSIFALQLAKLTGARVIITSSSDARLERDPEIGNGRMTKNELSARYRAYIDCLNRRDWPRLGDHVADEARYNGKMIGLAGYRQMLEGDVAAIPNLKFEIDFLVADPPTVGARLLFDCTPRGELFGLPVNGRRVTFTENVFYRFAHGKIESVWSVIDQAAIRAQLRL
jgi:predicted ester cyclase